MEANGVDDDVEPQQHMSAPPATPDADALGSAASERQRRLRAGILSNGVARLGGMIMVAVSVPIVARSLEPGAYAIYVLATSAAAVLPFVELGVGLSMVTSVAQAIGRGDDEAVRRSVSSAAVVTTAAAAAVASVWAAIFPWVQWADTLGLRHASEPEVRLALHLVVLSLCLGLPAALGFRLLLAQQRQNVVAWLQLGATAVSAASSIALAVAGAGPAAFVAAALIPLVVVSAVTTLILIRAHPAFRPSLRRASVSEGMSLLRLGSVFSVQQLAITVGSQVDTIVIARSLGAGPLATYGVAARLASAASQLASAMFVPLWPAFGEAHGRGDVTWIRRALRLALLGAGAAAVLCIVGFLVLGPAVQTAWAGHEYSPSRRLMLAFGSLGAIQFLSYPAQILLNALGVARFQLVAVLLMLAVNLPLTLLLVHPVGSAGPVFATVIATGTCICVPSLLKASSCLKHKS